MKDMTNVTSCADCPNKGCGPYHDVCDVYKKYKEKIKKRKNYDKNECTPIITKGQFLGHGPYIKHKSKRTRSTKY